MVRLSPSAKRSITSVLVGWSSSITSSARPSHSVSDGVEARPRAGGRSGGVEGLAAGMQGAAGRAALGGRTGATVAAGPDKHPAKAGLIHRSRQAPARHAAVRTRSTAAMTTATLDFTVTIATTDTELLEVSVLRAQAYGHHLPALAHSLAEPDAADLLPGTQVLLCRSKRSGQVIGTARLRM